MDFLFVYRALKGRFEAVLKKLQDEKLSWEQAGAAQVAQGTQLATMLAFQFNQLQSQWEDAVSSGSKLDFSLPNPKNPFVWTITLFGEAMTNLDGGIFVMKLHIPPSFPAVQPRVTLETPIYHHRVSSNGTLCYFPEKEDEIGSHLDAIVAAIDDKKQNFDPRAMVNPDIFDQYWGGEEKRKVYNRKLRRSAQESCEFL
jgi:ubiquitin-conjugating enzyme E2 Z